jgi:hypothetical protein
MWRSALLRSLVWLLAFWALAGPAVAQFLPDQFFSATCTVACTTAVMSTQGMGTVSIQATGTGGSLAFTFQGTNDGGVTWQTLGAVTPSAPSTVVTSASANGIWLVSAAGFSQVRVNLSAISSGSETFTLEASTRFGATPLGGGGGGGGSTSPGGSTTQVQVNLSNAFAGDPTFTFNSSTKVVSANIFNAGTAGFQLGGNTVLTMGASTIPVLFGGLSSGAAITLATATYDTGFGSNVLQHDTNSGGENSCFGAIACWQITTGTQDTDVGIHANGSSQTDSQNTAIGNDAQRNVVGGGGETSLGKDAGRDGSSVGGVTSNVFIGFQAGIGNGASLQLGGTITVGNIINLVFTASGSSPYTLPGSPVTVSYTVVSGDTTLAILAGHLITAINASAGLAAASPVQIENYNGADPATATVIPLDFAGTSTTGMSLVVSYAQGGNTETITITGGNAGVDLIAVGDQAMYGAQLTSATLDIGVGKLAMADLTTAARSIGIGPFSGEHDTTGSDNWWGGYAAGQAATTAFQITGTGSNACNAITTGSNVVCEGYKAGLLATTLASATLIGPQVGSTLALTGSNVVIIGAGSSAEPPTAATSNYLGLFGTAATAAMFCTGTQSTTPACTFPGGQVTFGVASTTGGSVILEGSTSGSATLTGGTTGVLTSTAAISTSGTVTHSGLSTSGTIAGVICATSAGLILFESGATSCTISLEDVKKDIAPLAQDRAVSDVMALQPIAFNFKDPKVPGRRYGFGAHQVNGVDPLLSTFDGRGALQAFDPNGILAELVAVVQQQQREIDGLRGR